MQRIKLILVEQVDAAYCIALVATDDSVRDDIANPHADRVEAESRAIRIARRHDCQWERANYSQV